MQSKNNFIVWADPFQKKPLLHLCTDYCTPNIQRKHIDMDV